MAKTPAPNDDTAEPANTEPGRTGSATAHAKPAPTEQLPLEPLLSETTPLSATSAASGRETGLAPEGRARPVFQRHPLATGIAAGAVAVVLVSGLTAWGVGAAATASLTSATSTSSTSTSSTSAGMPMGASTTAPSAGAAGTGTSARVAFRATIQSMDAGSWTILTRKGQTVTVTIDSSTRFGTRTASETAGSFAVGDSVVIVAMRVTDGKPVATRVGKAPTGS